MMDQKGKVLRWTAIVVVLAGLGLVMTAMAYNFPEELPGNYSLTNMTDDGEVAKASYENANGYEVVVSLTRCNAMDLYEEEKKSRAVYSDEIDGVEYTRLISFRSTVGFMWICDNETVGLLHVPRRNPCVDVGKIIIAMQTSKPTPTPTVFAGPYETTVDNEIFPQKLPGGYALTEINQNGMFIEKVTYTNESNASFEVCRMSAGAKEDIVKSVRINGVEVVILNPPVRWPDTLPVLYMWEDESSTYMGRMPEVVVEALVEATTTTTSKPTPTPRSGVRSITGFMYDGEDDYFVDGDTVTIYKYSIPYSDIVEDLANDCEQVSFSSVRGVEVLMGKSLQRWSEIPEEWYLCAWGNKTHTYMGWLPPMDAKHASVYGSGPVSEVTLEGLVEMTVERTPMPPGFEAVFAIVGVLAVAYLVHRQKR